MKKANARKQRSLLTARILCGLLVGVYLTGGYCIPVALGNGTSALHIYEDDTDPVIADETSVASAWGIGTTANTKGSTALGYKTTAGSVTIDGWEYIGNYATAWGYVTKAAGFGATAFGSDTKALNNYATAFGYLTTASHANATAFGYKTTASGPESTAFGFETKASNDHSTAFGHKSEASGADATAFGYNTTASGKIATAWGVGTEASGDRATSWGVDTVASGWNSTSWGTDTVASGEEATAWGYKTEASGKRSTAWGAESTAGGETSTAFGVESSAAGDNSLAALGGITDTAATNSAAIGKGAKATVADTVALGSDSVASRAAGDTNAYLKESNSGNAWVSTHNAIAVGDDDTATRQITGVAAGSKDTDAVNVAQLKEVSAGSALGLGALESRVTSLDGKVEKVGAGAAALAALHPLDTDSKFGIAAGYGNYRSANAMAMGLFYRPTDRIMFSLGGTMGNGENLMNVGVTFALDKGVTTSKAAMARTIKALEEKNANQAAKIESLEARLAALEAKMGK
jgi:autotransporter adhesin